MALSERGTGLSTNSTTSERVVSAVADARDTSPLELPPLYGVVDPDALDTLFARPNAGARVSSGRISFQFADCEVVVSSDGAVEVTAPDGRSRPSSDAGPVDGPDRSESALD